ncbi:MAG: hypothetical protein ABI134_05260, partial [Byssovorax sp.]
AHWGDTAMGEMIGSTADVTRVEEHIRSAFEKATARGGEVAAAAASRLGPAMAALDGAAPLQTSARKTASAAWVLVLAEDTKSDTGIGAVRDAMWNALGRPRQSPHMDEVFPGGVSTYTSGDPRGQPLLMQVLQARILSASAPQWTQSARQGWAAEIEALRVPYAAAVEAHRPAEATETVAEAGYRAAVRSGHTRLVSFKRDLKSLGLTETQIHEIIPDDGAGKSATKAAREPK